MKANSAVANQDRTISDKEMNATVSLPLSERSSPFRVGFFSLSELAKMMGDRRLGYAGLSTFIYEILLILGMQLREEIMMRRSVLQR